jgi:acetyl esterase/lipase
MPSDSLQSIRSQPVSVSPHMIVTPLMFKQPISLLTAANDVLTTWNFATSSAAASQLKIDSRRIALFGSSAGAALAAGLAIRLKDDPNQVQPLLTILDRYAGIRGEVRSAGQIAKHVYTPAHSVALDDRLDYPAQQESHPLRAYHVCPCAWPIASSIWR